MADPEFHKPAPVQLLIGAGTSLSTLCIGNIKISLSHEPDLVLQKTLFGWIIAGNVPASTIKNTKNQCFILNIQDISKFWELEEIAAPVHLSAEETRCENHFLSHTQRDIDGRYIVSLPFNDDKDYLGESHHLALKRLDNLERRLTRQADLRLQYSNAIQEYINLGYMTKIKEPKQNGFYLPHQAVIKESSTTTKVRVVFDASAKTNTGYALNDTLLAGPTIQDDIFSLLLRFRTHNYVLTGDIEKMYLQIKICHNDQKYLRILWRESDGHLSTYQFNRLIFGLKPASYLAIRCIHQLADDERDTFPRASAILKNDLYVDDLLTGANTLEEVIQLRQELTKLLKRGGFNLRQCASNSAQVIETIPDHKINLSLQEGNASTLKTLGLHWNSTQDSIIYTVNPLISRRITKRTIFSEIAKIFDPLGLLNPVIVVAKLIMQELWKLKIDWDESLPIEINTRWQKFASQLSILNQISFSRKILQNYLQDVQLHGFCDASQAAYGACIYIRSVDFSGNIKIELFCAKSRVAPIKTQQTIPRLELCAATLLATLYQTVKSSINININRTLFWTDSMIALHWIKTSPHTLKTFVANRVADIQTKSQSDQWRHVRTHDNPADLLSRGLLPAEFKEAKIWVSGPAWLSENEDQWPEQPNIKTIDLPEVRKPTCLTACKIDMSFLFRYSSYDRLCRVIAFCLRILPNNKHRSSLTAEELQNASTRVLLLTQKSQFSEEFKSLVKGQQPQKHSKLLNLNPFIGKDGLIRVGGRLHHSMYSYEKRHPIILPKSHYVTELLIDKVHRDNLHGGMQSTLYSLRQLYWPIDGRNQVRKVIRRCVRCARAKPRSVEYIMGSLPSARTIETRPFTNIGVDYCGPFFIKEKRFRNRNKIKIYVAVFICLSTKAVHLEVPGDLSTEGFIAALKRLISRRGICNSIYSDNGTNFVGANNELKDLHALITSKAHNDKVQYHLAKQGIKWNFNPPHSPHFGGIWEAAVKSFKYHLKRVVGTDLFTYEQFNTLTIEIEAVLNSRPLTPLSSDPHDLTPLTPSHFLIGDTLSSLPEQDFSGTPVNKLSAWQHIQKVKRDFWARWHKEYINELNIRHKWNRRSHDIRVGTIVLLRDDNLPPLHWKLARVIEIYPGHDGIIRTVRVRTAKGEFERCVKKLAPLPVDTGLPKLQKTPN